MTPSRARGCRRFGTTLLLGTLWTASAARAELPWTTTPLSSPPLPSGADVGEVWISPDGAIAVYGISHPSGSEGYVELRCTRLDGDVTGVSVTTGILAEGFGDKVAFSPDSRRVAFTAAVDVGPGIAPEVWSIEVCRSGGEVVRMSPGSDATPGAQIELLSFTPDAQRVLFLSDHHELQIYRVFSAPAAGGGPTVELGGAQPFEFNKTPVFAPTPDSQRLILSRRNDAGLVDLVTVPVAGPASDETILVHGTSTAAGYPIFRSTTPLAGRLVYVWNDESGGVRREIYSTPLAGPPDQDVKLNPPLPAHADVGFLAALAPDGSRVGYAADVVADGVLELFSVPTAGPAAATTRISKPMPAGSAGLRDFFFLPDSSRVIYAATQEVAGRYDLYSVPAAGPASSGVRLNAGDPLDGQYFSMLATPDSQLVVFTGADTTGPSGGALHLRRADGTGIQRNLCTDVPAGGPVPGSGGIFAACHDGGFRQLHHWRVSPVTLAAVRTDVTPFDDAGDHPIPLFGPTAIGGVLYTDDHPVAGAFELFAADRRVFLNGFESATSEAWSATVP